MRTLSASELSSVDNVQGLRFWNLTEYSQSRFQDPGNSGQGEFRSSKPHGGLWLSPVIGHTDAWSEYLDSVGWYGRIEHEVELHPDTPVLVLDDEHDADEYVTMFCDEAFPGIPQVQNFNIDRFREAGHSALYASRHFISRSRLSEYWFVHHTWDVPSLWISNSASVAEVRPVRVNS